MKKTIFCIAVLLGVFLFTGGPVPGAGNLEAIDNVADMNHKSGKLGKYHALLIGINEYKDPLFLRLDTARNDAEAMARVLGENYGFRTRLLLDKKATWDAISDALRKLVGDAKENDSVLIYYAGHGKRDRDLGGGWWIPTDAAFGKYRTYLRNTEVQLAISSMKARHVLVVSDSCYSGTLFGKPRGGRDSDRGDGRYYLNLYNEKSRWGITSGNKEPVWDDGSGGHSIFAYQLIRTLENNQKRFVSTQEIYTKIAPVIGNNSEQTPMCRPIRNVGGGSGEFVFVASSAAIIDRLSPKSTLEVICNVRDAQVLLDGRHIGYTDLPDTPISPGKHQLMVKKDGYEPYQRELEARARLARSVEVFLREKKEPDMRSEAVAVKEPVRKQPVAKGPKKEISNTLGMKFVYIPPGDFMMGSPENESGRYDNEKQRKVRLTKGFYMQTTEVTQGQWKAVMENNPSYFDSCGDNCPVETVSWNDVQDFIKKLNQKEGTDKYRLPTEAEWEYAARAGTSTAYSWGRLSDCSKANCGSLDECEGKNPKKVMSVASFSPNSWGLYDMHGNVCEWCRDWYEDYPPNFVTDPGGPPAGSDRVGRGGSWFILAGDCRAADRSGYSPDYRDSYLGLRLALSPGQHQ